jgi:hypothetical protein
MWDGTAGNMKVIWVNREAEYFSRRDWTGRNSLIRLEKLGFTRKSADGAMVRSPGHFASSVRRCIDWACFGFDRAANELFSLKIQGCVWRPQR